VTTKRVFEQHFQLFHRTQICSFFLLITREFVSLDVSQDSFKHFVRIYMKHFVRIFMKHFISTYIYLYICIYIYILSRGVAGFLQAFRTHIYEAFHTYIYVYICIYIYILSRGVSGFHSRFAVTHFDFDCGLVLI